MESWSDLLLAVLFYRLVALSDLLWTLIEYILVTLFGLLACPCRRRSPGHGARRVGAARLSRKGGNKQGSTLSGKWRSLAGLLPGGGLKAGPPLDPPRPSIISLFHPPGVGPAQTWAPDVREEASFGCSMVLAYGQVFTLEASEARAPHTPQI